jgi:monoterpene epsilon-lactone hydrolase
VVVIGASAGGSLALSMVQRLREKGSALPRAMALVTPWSELGPIGDTYEANEGRDPIIRWNGQLDQAAAAYAGLTSYDDPLISPIHADYDDTFPPSLITSGTRDLFLSNCVRLYWKLRRAGAQTELLVWEGMWHAFLGDPELPEAKECRDEIAAFLWKALDD